MPTLPRGCVRPGADCHVWQTTSRKRTAPSRPGSRRLGLSSWARPAGQRSGPTRYSPEPTTPGTSLIRRVARAAGVGAAIAAGLTSLDVGLDTLGSIQNPAHYCGVY